MKRAWWALPAILIVAGCSGKPVVVDRSTPAVEAGDYTLALSACGSVPGGGMDVCHVRAGAKIESAWKIFVPQGEGGEVDVYYKDIHRSYAVKGPIVEIPWKDFMQAETWKSSMDGEALALAIIRYKTPSGVEEIVKYRGIAKIVVTREGYDRLPVDSGFMSWGLTCKIQYSTTGRGVVECK